MPKKIAKAAAVHACHGASIRLTAGLVAMTLLLFAGSISADDGKLSGLPSLILGGQTADAPTYNFEQPLVERVKTPQLDIVLDKTTLEDIKAAFGGEIRTRSAGNIAVGWLCYTIPARDRQRRVWFIADGEDASGAKPTLTMVSVEDTAESRDDCDKGQFDVSSWRLPVPTLGGNPDSLRQRFGNAPDEGIVRYAHENPGGNAGAGLSQSLVYRQKGGQIDGLAFSQETSR
ncbi:hypothetical protein ILFOPFJJ_04018 [Ensifer psoraleae]|uniref:hypothetical protein n=1 Tax=Sinorhizobium psoraleae TaxID=520838 RepID=UPI00156A1DF4|nr:hypothetical protein [Sinorhizobium psoraleae]NRP73119.1 hypothetical protein [Sinorhizobium psoraleae]